MDCFCEKLEMSRVDGSDKFVLRVETQPIPTADKTPHATNFGNETTYAAEFPDQVDSWVIKLVSGSITVDGITISTVGHARSGGASPGKTYPKPTITINTGGSTYEWSAVV